MANRIPSFVLKISKTCILTSFLLLVVSNCFSQWKTAEANNIKSDIIISYEVIYDKELSAEEKKLPEYFNEITVSFNKDNLIERKFGDKPRSPDVFTLYNYNTLKWYSCMALENNKKAIQFDFKEPNTAFEPAIKSSKVFFDYPCEKAVIMINNTPKEVYYTKKIGLRYCRQLKIDGFLMEFPGYSKTLGYYTVKAKKIIYDDLPNSFYSLDGFSIQTVDEAKKSLQESKEKMNEIRMNFIGKTADNFKEFSIKNEKIDTKNMAGDIIVYNFWFTTCAPCKAEIPKLNELKEKYKGKNVHFIAIALDPEYKISPFLKMFPLNYDIIPEGRWIADKFGVNAYPTNIIVDKKGTIQFCEMGYKSDIVERMTSTLDQYLNE